VKDFKQTIDGLHKRASHHEADTDVEDVLRHASSIDRFMTANRLDASAQRDWQNLRRALDELERMYGVIGTGAAPSICGHESPTGRSGQLPWRTKKNGVLLERYVLPSRSVCVDGPSTARWWENFYATDR
jgi:hypothetical protein